MVLSIPGKGSGCTPTWLYIWASISNLRSATLATISSIFTQINSVSPFKFFWEYLNLKLPLLRLRKLRQKLPHGCFVKHGRPDKTWRTEKARLLGYKFPYLHEVYTKSTLTCFVGLHRFHFLWIVSFCNHLANNSRVAILIWTKMSKRGGNCSYLLVLSRYLG